MAEKKTKKLLENGVWIQRQHGVLTMGSLEKTDDAVVELSSELSEAIDDFEEDMMAAMYGDNVVPFKPDEIRVNEMLLNVVNQFELTGVRVSVSCSPEDAVVKGDYDQLLDLMSGFVQNSLESGLKTAETPVLYINASVLEDNLCIIYWDSCRVERKNSLKKEFDCIENSLQGEISEKTTAGRASYFDIVIPLEQVKR